MFRVTKRDLTTSKQIIKDFAVGVLLGVLPGEDHGL